MNNQYDIENGAAINTGIGWCTHTWNPLRYRVKTQHVFAGHGAEPLPIVPVGAVVNYCQKISPGCVHCYAERQGKRKRSPDFTVPNLELVEPFIDEKELLAPLGMKIKDRDGLKRDLNGNAIAQFPKPHRRPALFCADMTDLWGPWVPFEMIDRIMAVAALRPDITFMFLTKRTARMVEYFSNGRYEQVSDAATDIAHDDLANTAFWQRLADNITWPLPNVLLGFSAENQEYFDSRWFDMRKLAALGWKVFASIEPMISPVNVENMVTPRLSWAVIGGESGHGARPFNVQWMRDSIAQFKAAGVPLWCKQVGRVVLDSETLEKWKCDHWSDDGIVMDGPRTKDSHGGDWNEWPADLRVRELLYRR